MTDNGSRGVLIQACAEAGLTAEPAELIRAAENDLWRLPGRIVARIARNGQAEVALRETLIARWLAQAAVPAVRLHGDVDQPVNIGGRAVTFWRELPPHRQGTPAEVASLLKSLHALPLPDFDLPPVRPFVRIHERITAARSVTSAERHWLLQRLQVLKAAWADLPPGLPQCVIHGDAWVGNVAVTDSGPEWLDFERTAVGPPEWDLTSTAVGVDLFDHVSRVQYEQFCAAYGTDVTTWAGYETLRNIRELRVTTYALQIADYHPPAVNAARYRLECLQGQHGPRPWRWPTVP
ncbi:phosphotransferase family protein [Streptacidiphilus sp. N1-3]|uniref:Phosphotransferase family protein n=1 Tax=Streptacidiphilus alkalitolerans TaxID=3342712 RepID=A0ABV6XAP2_9ACTN